MSKVLFALLVVTGLQVVHVATFNLTISPDHLRVSAGSQSVSFTCSADVALVGCQFSWWDGLYIDTAPQLELSRGSQSQANPAHLSGKLTGYSYSGRGLGAGDCGVSMQVEDWQLWIVACRVRAESGGWKYAWAEMIADRKASLPHNRTTPREAVVLPGGEARFMLNAGEPLRGCRFLLPGGSSSSSLFFDQGAESARSTSRHHYLGAGLQSGECGLALSNISEVDNGPVRGVISTPTNNTESRFSALIVARRPTAPTLSLVYTSNQVTATCEVNESRPLANMSWVLGDEVISQDYIYDTHSRTQDEWRWPWTLASIKQTVTLQLQPQHNGKDLKCVVSHFTLEQPLVARQPVSFTDVASYSLVMSPEHQHIYKSLQTVFFTCTANVSLAGCQFSWWDFGTGAGGMLDLSRGSESQRNPAHLNSRFGDYRYSGQGLWDGDCGISMKVQGLKTWIVACRVRPQIGDWKYARAELYADDWTPMTNTLTTPREAVVVPGGEARFIIQGQGPLLQCRFNLPGVSGAVYFNDGAKSNNSTGRHRYLGAGLQSGECGLALSNVSEADNGPVRVYMRAPNWKEHIRFVALIVERRPTAPIMDITYNHTHLTATCEVKNGRPEANITWYLGNDIIHRGKDDYAPHDEWRWPWMPGAIKQTIRRQLNTQYQGKELRCVVTHATLDQPLEDRQLISFTGVATFKVTISSDHQRVTSATQSVYFTCTTDVALVGCQFRWWDHNNKAGPLLELSQGPRSQADRAHLNRAVTGYSYSGRGLGAGDCGIYLQVEGWKAWIVACRVQAESGGWKYAWADLYASVWAPVPSNWTTPREVVVLPGGEARFVLKTGEPIKRCLFLLPGRGRSVALQFDQGAESSTSTGRHLYLGAGLQSGECGLALSNISETDNGPVNGGIYTSTEKYDTRFSALIVALPPTAPTLSLVYTGNSVTATCEVQRSRPVANMSWVLGDKVIRQDDIDDTQAWTQDEWRWPWTTGAFKQTLKLQRHPQHNGKQLKCVVSHVTLDQPLDSSQLISFTG